MQSRTLPVSMNFTDVKSRLLQALKTGDFEHEARRNITAKNKLQTGECTTEDVIKLVERCRGNSHSQSEHDQVSGIMVHVIKAQSWYIKFYFLEPSVMFISVHLQER